MSSTNLEEKSKDDQIIVKLTFSNNIFDQPLKEYSGYLNEIFKTYYHGEIYLEEIHEGYLMIFDNYDSFKKHHSVSHKLKEFDFTAISKKYNNLLFGHEITQLEYPKEGIYTYIEISSNHHDDLTDIVSQCYNSIRSEIEVEITSLDKISVFIPTFNSLKILVHSIFMDFILSQIKQQNL